MRAVLLILASTLLAATVAAATSQASPNTDQIAVATASGCMSAAREAVWITDANGRKPHRIMNSAAIPPGGPRPARPAVKHEEKE